MIEMTLTGAQLQVLQREGVYRYIRFVTQDGEVVCQGAKDSKLEWENIELIKDSDNVNTIKLYEGQIQDLQEL